MTDQVDSNCKPHLYRVGPHEGEFDDVPDKKEGLRKHIEPWLSAIFQSEHLSLLLGSGFTIGVAAGEKVLDMTAPESEHDDASKIKRAALDSARKSGRGQPNFEDYIRVANELLRGYEILRDKKAEALRKETNKKLKEFLESILEAERSVLGLLLGAGRDSERAHNLLVSFLLSFASRVVSRERLHVFTTNYDRLIEYGCDLAGLRIVDRFVGTLTPVFRASRLNIDLHYNPPGIRGEPRYLEGVIRLFKLHGSLDWRQENRQIRRYGIPFGAPKNHPDIPTEPLNSVMVYPNAAKDMETLEYPYAELFRDFAAAVCRPNSALVTYGYGFGDDHINRVIRDMLTVSSTHLVIVSYDDPSKVGKVAGRIERFCSDAGHKAQISLLIGTHFGSLEELVENYLPKPAIDLISAKRTELVKRREIDPTQFAAGGTDISAVHPGGGDDGDTD